MKIHYPNHVLILVHSSPSTIIINYFAIAMMQAKDYCLSSYYSILLCIGKTHHNNLTDCHTISIHSANNKNIYKY